jgi:hypothetical protein
MAHEPRKRGEDMRAPEIPVDVDVLRDEIEKTYSDVATDT